MQRQYVVANGCSPKITALILGLSTFKSFLISGPIKNFLIAGLID